MNKITIGKYTRISKAAARKLFLDGKTIAIVPCKCNPDNKFFPAFTANRWDKEEFVIDEIGMKNYFDNKDVFLLIPMFAMNWNSSQEYRQKRLLKCLKNLIDAFCGF